MKFVEEVVVESVLPTFRAMLADALRERGLTQREVAESVGVSQSAVSKYVHDEVTRHPDVAAHPRIRELVAEIADGLASGEMSRAQALVEAEVLIRELEADDLVARLHEAEMPAFAEYEGRIRDPESPVRTAEQVLSSVRRAVRVLENARGFAAVIPAVGSNVCECLPDARTIEDVAGVPGRIVDVKGRATIPGDPEFGASEHVARVLLAARGAHRPPDGSSGQGQRAGSDARSCLNVAYDPELVTRLEAAGAITAEFDAEADLEDAIAGALAGASAEHPGTPEDRTAPTTESSGSAAGSTASSADPARPQVLYQTGGFGIEPIVYVLGEDAEAVARTVREAL